VRKVLARIKVIPSVLAVKEVLAKKTSGDD
jgi:hypothetical protein